MEYGRDLSDVSALPDTDRRKMGMDIEDLRCSGVLELRSIAGPNIKDDLLEGDATVKVGLLGRSESGVSGAVPRGSGIIGGYSLMGLDMNASVCRALVTCLQKLAI